jgi:hypothetical protein
MVIKLQKIGMVKKQGIQNQDILVGQIATVVYGFQQNPLIMEVLIGMFNQKMEKHTKMFTLAEKLDKEKNKL